MKLSNFFNPKSIAIIGASDHNDKVGGILLERALKSKAEIIPINPKHETLLGLKSYKNVLNYPKAIDLAIIAVPKEFVLQSLKDCGKKGIKEVIIISAGFSEIGNKEDEEKLKIVANNYRIKILGPNCFGTCNPDHKLDLTFSKTTPKKGDIAFISQSGALWSYIADYSSEKFGFSGFASLGNMADLEFSDMIDYFNKDDKTKSIVLYIEKLKNGRKFIDICNKSKKRIYAIKAGSTSEGSKAAFSHTGSLATDYEIYKGAFKQAKVILCNSILDAFEKATHKKLIKHSKEESINHIKIGKKVLIITNAGGAGALLSDYLASDGFHIIEKPQDILGTAQSIEYKQALIEADKKDCNSIIIVLTPQSMTQLEETAREISNFKKQTNKDIIALFLGEASMKESDKILEENKIIYFNTLEEAKERLVF